MSMQDPWSTSTPPGPQTETFVPGPPNMPPQPPQPPGKSKTPLIAGIAGAVALIVIIVLVVVLAGGGKKHGPVQTSIPPQTSPTAPPSTSAAPTTAATPTTAAGSSSNSGASLLSSIPSAFQSDCETSQPSDFIDSDASDQVICSGSNVPTADGIIYIQYSDSSGSEGYYTKTLLAGNGMQQDQGDCGTLTFSGTASNGNYCETAISDQGSSSTTGRQFVFAGSSFNVGSGGNLSGVCKSSSSGFTVVGWTDDPTNLTAIAVSCTSDTSTEKTLQNHYLQGDYDLNS